MALAIDLLLISVLNLLVSFLLAGWLVFELTHLALLDTIVIVTTWLAVMPAGFVFVHLVYFTIFHACCGQTIGKMLMGIKVVTMDDGLIRPGGAFLRWTGYLVSFLPLAAGFLWSAVDREHCAWHDRLARTRVVTAEMT